MYIGGGWLLDATPNEARDYGARQRRQGGDALGLDEVGDPVGDPLQAAQVWFAEVSRAITRGLVMCQREGRGLAGNLVAHLVLCLRQKDWLHVFHQAQGRSRARSMCG